MTNILKKGPYRFEEGKLLIEINLRNYLQLFDSRDPAPLIEKDLDDKVVDYILSVVKETSSKKPCKIIIYFTEALPRTVTPQIIQKAIHNFFSYSSELTKKKIRHTFRLGRFSFMVAIIVLVTCLTLSQWISQHPNIIFSRVLREGFTILGWVAMWRPIDVFLYSWWPQVEDRKIFQKLSEADVDIQVLKTSLSEAS
jgi:hypothetical protein